MSHMWDGGRRIKYLMKLTQPLWSLRTLNKAVVKIPRRENTLTFGPDWQRMVTRSSVFSLNALYSPRAIFFQIYLGRSQDVYHSHLDSESSSYSSPGSPNYDRKPPNSNLLPSYIGDARGCFVQMSLLLPRKNWVRLPEGEIWTLENFSSSTLTLILSTPWSSSVKSWLRSLLFPKWRRKTKDTEHQR